MAKVATHILTYKNDNVKITKLLTVYEASKTNIDVGTRPPSILTMNTEREIKSPAECQETHQ